MEGPPGGAVPYKHFGARLARLGRFDSCTLYQEMFRADGVRLKRALLGSSEAEGEAAERSATFAEPLKERSTDQRSR